MANLELSPYVEGKQPEFICQSDLDKLYLKSISSSLKMLHYSLSSNTRNKLSNNVADYSLHKF